MRREIKREAEDFKRRYHDAENQLNEVKRERDELKSLKHDESLKVLRDFERDNSAVKDLQAEIERLKFKLS